jgi:hypothetical protein
MNDHVFEYHPKAIEEAWEAFNWYNERSLVVAERFWNELHRARRSVTLHPTSWTPYLFGTRCFKLKRYPFGLFILNGKLASSASQSHT